MHKLLANLQPLTIFTSLSVSLPTNKGTEDNIKWSKTKKLIKFKNPNSSGKPFYIMDLKKPASKKQKGAQENY